MPFIKLCYEFENQSDNKISFKCHIKWENIISVRGYFKNHKTGLHKFSGQNVAKLKINIKPNLNLFTYKVVFPNYKWAKRKSKDMEPAVTQHS